MPPVVPCSHPPSSLSPYSVVPQHVPRAALCGLASSPAAAACDGQARCWGIRRGRLGHCLLPLQPAADACAPAAAALPAAPHGPSLPAHLNAAAAAAPGCWRTTAATQGPAHDRWVCCVACGWVWWGRVLTVHALYTERFCAQPFTLRCCSSSPCNNSHPPPSPAPAVQAVPQRQGRMQGRQQPPAAATQGPSPAP